MLINSWRYWYGTNNLVDIFLRGMSSLELLESVLWIEGFIWLNENGESGSDKFNSERFL